MREVQKTNDELVDVFKALSNTKRLKILQLLKETEGNFPMGICVGDIRDRLGLGQSTTSQYLSLLNHCGLLESKRVGQWTYYRRNEKMIKNLVEYIGEEL